MSTTIASLNAARPAGAATLRASKTVALRAAPVARRSAGRASVVTTRAAVDASVAYAVAQQDLFFAAVVAGECLYQQGNLPADFKGRPSLTDLPVPCGMLVGSFALIQTDQPLLSRGAPPRRRGVRRRGQVLPRSLRCHRRRRYGLARPRIFPGTGLLFSLFVLLADLEALPRIMDGY